MPRGYPSGTAPPNHDLVWVNVALATLRRDLRDHADAARIDAAELTTAENALTYAIETIGALIAGRSPLPAATLEFDDRD